MHVYCGEPRSLQCFMVTSSFGCTQAYLEQLHLRLVREHATFAGEAFVAQTVMARHHGGASSLVESLREKLSETWFKWRMSLRLRSMLTAGCAGVLPGMLDLRQPTEVCAEALWEPAITHFEATTVEAARGASKMYPLLPWMGT